ncbi:MAG: hypothetical protein ABFD79_06515 [Phycisphaerales bacterium]
MRTHFIQNQQRINSHHHQPELTPPRQTVECTRTCGSVRAAWLRIIIYQIGSAATGVDVRLELTLA